MEDMNNIKKRVRDYESDSEHGSVEVKRLRDDLLDFLDESDPVPASPDLDSFMKSFEEEISAANSCSTSPRPAPEASAAPVPVVDLTSDSGESNPDLTHLLEASDDELGLPPSGGFSGEAATDLVRVLSDSSAVEELWRFDDQGPSYDSFELSAGAGSNFDDSGYVAFDGLFEHSDVYYDSSDYSDFSWRFETLPAAE